MHSASGSDPRLVPPQGVSPGWGTLALVAAVVLAAMLPYHVGYRLSGDDMWFLRLAVDGAEPITTVAFRVAQEQGRIGQVLMIPINVMGAVLAGDPVWRAVLVGVYVLQLLAFAVFVARLLRREVSLFLFVLLAALHPLTFAFMPPNAYPLQNTVPLIAILLSRLVLLDLRRRDAVAPVRAAAAQGAFALGMFVSEFAVAFGTALLIAEYLERTQAAREAGESWTGTIRAAFVPRYVAADSAAVLAVLVPYVLFRWAYPSSYEGNSAGGLFAPGRVAITVAGHVRDGTAFPRLGGGLSSASAVDLLVALVTGAAVAAALHRLSPPVLRLRAPGATAAAGLLLACYVTLPVAVSAKYQEACVDRGACAYLDSRISYLAVSVALMGAVALACRLAGSGAARRRALWGACAALGVMASLVSVYNAGKARPMRLVNAVWQRADALACANPPFSGEGKALVAAIDPQGLVIFNQPGDAADFWPAYMPWRASRICDDRMDKTGAAGQD